MNVDIMGLSPSEYMRYAQLPEPVRVAYEELQQELEELRAEAKGWDRQEELLREQIGFAQQLLDEIEYDIKHNTVAKEMRQAIIMTIENSYFER